MNIKTANRLCELRKKNNLSQEELAEKLGVSRQAVSKWERSEASPDTDNLILLAKLYNVTLDELVNGEEEASLAEENKDADRNASEETKTPSQESFIVDEKEYKAEVTEEKITITDKASDHVSEYDKKEFITRESRFNLVEKIVTGAFALNVTIFYLAMGFIFNGGSWFDWWFLFILIPVVSGIINTIKMKSFNEFPMAVLIAAIYCGICCQNFLWHPLWLLFLIIPVYHIIFSNVDKKLHKDDYKRAQEAYKKSLKK